LVQSFTDREARHISDHLPEIADVRVAQPTSGGAAASIQPRD
jgi:hypothetical protein